MEIGESDTSQIGLKSSAFNLADSLLVIGGLFMTAHWEYFKANDEVDRVPSPSG